MWFMTHIADCLLCTVLPVVAVGFFGLVRVVTLVAVVTRNIVLDAAQEFTSAFHFRAESAVHRLGAPRHV